MAAGALQGPVFGCDHVGQGPVHGGLGEPVLPAVLQPGQRLGQTCGLVPVELAPVATRSHRLRGEKIVVGAVVELVAAMHLERPDLRAIIVNVAQGIVDVGHPGGVDRIAFQVAGGPAVVPVVLGLNVALIAKAALDLQILVGVIDGQVLPGLGPIPAHLGGLPYGELGDVAGLAGHCAHVGIEPVVAVGGSGMAIGAADVGDVIDAHRHGAAGDVVIRRMVAFDAGKIVAAHVDVHILGGEVHGLVQIAMLDCIAAATVEMAVTAVGAIGQGNALCRGQQIDLRSRVAGGRLAVVAGAVMTDQAVDAGGIGEVEGLVLPAVAGMAAGAFRPVPLDADAEIVDQVLLADGYRLIMAGDMGRSAFPLPVGGLHEIVSLLDVALQAGSGDRRPISERLREELRVIHVGRVPG